MQQLIIASFGVLVVSSLALKGSSMVRKPPRGLAVTTALLALAFGGGKVVGAPAGGVRWLGPQDPHYMMMVGSGE